MKIFKLIISLSVISAICAGVLAGINVVTKDSIAKIREKQIMDAAAEVMPASVDKSKIEQIKDGMFVGKDASGKVAGYASRGRTLPATAAKSFSWSAFPLISRFRRTDRKSVV